ncbi:hypothetical protein HMPREF1863_00954 [Aedoeadaptatus coxii]|uniref:Uncharacterized protein n=1 Tax=Aedoeadaptatus coxii TaxID=755172 RepID=A0A134AGQ8_9FIRM|nr:hypothetical protein HMPREF1863_00954 [Peptoniphilus coxii]
MPKAFFVIVPAGKGDGATGFFGLCKTDLKKDFLLETFLLNLPRKLLFFC